MEKLKKFLLKNYVSRDGDIDISELDLSDFDGNIFANSWKVKRSLDQGFHEVGGNLEQDLHTVKGSIYQGFHTVKGDLWQDGHTIKGDYYSGDSEVRGQINISETVKDLKEITVDELADMGYKLVKDDE